MSEADAPPARRRPVLLNILFNQAGYLASIAVAFVVSPILVHGLGDDLYGLWSMIGSLTSHYGLLTLGMQAALTRYIAFSVGRDDRAAVDRYLGASLWVFWPAALAILLVGGALATFFGEIFGVDPAQREAVDLACMVVAASVSVAFALIAFRCVLIGHQRFDSTNGVGVSATIARGVGVVWLIAEGHGIVAIASLHLGLAAAAGLADLALARAQVPGWRATLRSPDRGAMRELMSYGTRQLVETSALVLIYQCDLFVIGLSEPHAALTTYGLAATLAIYLRQFAATIVHVLDAYAADLFARGGLGRLATFYLRGARVMYMIAGLAVGGCVVFGRPFFTLWIDAEHADSADILTLLAIPQFFGIGAAFGHCALVAMARIRGVTRAAVAGGVANLLLSLVLVRFHGIAGVAIATLIPMVAIDGLWFVPYIGGVLGIPVRRIALGAVVPGLGVLGLTLAVGFGASALAAPASWPVLAMDIAVTVLASAGVVLYAWRKGL